MQIKFSVTILVHEKVFILTLTQKVNVLPQG